MLEAHYARAFDDEIWKYEYNAMKSYIRRALDDDHFSFFFFLRYSMISSVSSGRKTKFHNQIGTIQILEHVVASRLMKLKIQRDNKIMRRGSKLTCKI